MAEAQSSGGEMQMGEMQMADWNSPYSRGAVAAEDERDAAHGVVRGGYRGSHGTGSEEGRRRGSEEEHAG